MCDLDTNWKREREGCERLVVEAAPFNEVFAKSMEFREADHFVPRFGAAVSRLEKSRRYEYRPKPIWTLLQRLRCDLTTLIVPFILSSLFL